MIVRVTGPEEEFDAEVLEMLNPSCLLVERAGSPMEGRYVTRHRVTWDGEKWAC